MTEDSGKLAIQLKTMAVQNDIDTTVVLRTLMLATAQLLEANDPQVIKDMRTDIDALKKRDWYGLATAAVIAVVTSAMAWLKK